MKRLPALIFVFCSTLVFFSCGEKKQAQQESKPEAKLPELPGFNADSAYAFIKAQCEFGPRVPNTPAHVSCGDYLIAKMKSWCDTVYVQSGTVTAFDKTKLRFRNIIGSINPSATRRILLFAHWDTRPWADRDTAGTDKPPLGADDGGSGIGVLMEVARQLHITKPQLGIDFAFFDAEDWGEKDGGDSGQDTYALGTQYWTKNLHTPGYTAQYGILLDMVGARNAQFRKEGYSKSQAGFVVDNVWQIATRLGHSSYFLYEDAGWVTDDHVYVNQVNIPSIDIINSDRGTKSGFAPHWHTHKDNMEVIDRSTLLAVGQTLLGVIFWEGV